MGIFFFSDSFELCSFFESCRSFWIVKAENVLWSFVWIVPCFEWKAKDKFQKRCDHCVLRFLYLFCSGLILSLTHSQLPTWNCIVCISQTELPFPIRYYRRVNPGRYCIPIALSICYQVLLQGLQYFSVAIRKSLHAWNHLTLGSFYITLFGALPCSLR